MNGQPSADILPTHLFAKAAQKAFTAPNAANDVLQVILVIHIEKHISLTTINTVILYAN